MTPLDPEISKQLWAAARQGRLLEGLSADQCRAFGEEVLAEFARLKKQRGPTHARRNLGNVLLAFKRAVGVSVPTLAPLIAIAERRGDFGSLPN